VPNVSAVLVAPEADQRHSDGSQAYGVRNFELLATASGGIRQVRLLILTLAIQGKLLPRRHATAATISPPGREHRPAQGPAAWESVKLGDVVEVLDSQRKPVKREDRRPGPIPYYGASGVVDLVDDFIFDEPLVLVGEDGAKWGPGDATAFSISGKAWVNNHAHVLRPNRARLTDAYLVTALTAMDLSPYVTGMTVPKLNQARLLSVALALPPVDEQVRIADRVNELMQLCDALEAKSRLEADQHARLLATLLETVTDSRSPEELAVNWTRLAAHFELLLDRPEAVDALEQCLVGMAVSGLLSRSPQGEPGNWPRVRFADVLEELRYGTAVKCGYDRTGTPVLRIPNLQKGGIDTADLKFGVLEERERTSLALRPGELLIVRSNGSASLVGTVAVVDETATGFAFAGYLVRARLDPEKVDPKYMLLVSQTRDFRRQIEAPIRTTSGVKNINSSEISALMFLLPSLAEQRRAVALVQEFRSLCARLRDKLALAQTLQSRLAEALAMGASSRDAAPI
jgi:type I restriction enzyme, S subunit